MVLGQKPVILHEDPTGIESKDLLKWLKYIQRCKKM